MKIRRLEPFIINSTKTAIRYPASNDNERSFFSLLRSKSCERSYPQYKNRRIGAVYEFYYATTVDVEADICHGIQPVFTI